LFSAPPVPGPCHAGRPRRTYRFGKPGVVLLRLSTPEIGLPNRPGPGDAGHGAALQSPSPALVPAFPVVGGRFASGRRDARGACPGRALGLEPLAASPGGGAVYASGESRP